MRRLIIFGLFLFLLVPGRASAAPLEVSGWIPYWRAATGTVDVIPHMRLFTSIMPFGYVVQNDGSIKDAFGLNATSSTSTAAVLVAVAQASHVRIVPTVMWSNGAAMDRILSDGPSRRALEDRIADLAKEGGFDGIDIDFEGKFASTKPYFSLFLKGLYERMGKKWVYCSIEPRTPPESAFDIVPDKLEYANDYVAINKYCDRVTLMTYDQASADRYLNHAASQTPYVPIADPVWVEKVVNLAAKSIAKKKLVIGIPTYGYEYDLIPLTQGYRYDMNWALNPSYATTLADELGLTPVRNIAGEMSFVYVPTTTPATASTTMRVVWWSDASAIRDKIQLAKKLGVRGVAIFKLDGGEDRGLWDALRAR